MLKPHLWQDLFLSKHSDALVLLTMTSSKVTRASNTLHLSVLGSNSLRGGLKDFSSGVLGGNWFETRLQPSYQKWDSKRKRSLRRNSDKYYRASLGELTDLFTQNHIQDFNSSGRSDANLLKSKSSANPITQFVPPDPHYGHPPPGKWDTMYELTYGHHPFWREKTFDIDRGGNYLNYQKYNPSDHWKTTHMDDYRYHRPPYEQRVDLPLHPLVGDTTAETDLFRPCFLTDTHLRHKYDRSTQTEYNSQYPPLKRSSTLAELEEFLLDEEFQEEQIPLQPTWLTGGTGRGQKPTYSSYCTPPCWPPPWRNDEAADGLVSKSAKPAAIQDLITIAAAKRGDNSLSHMPKYPDGRHPPPSLSSISFDAYNTDKSVQTPQNKVVVVDGDDDDDGGVEDSVSGLQTKTISASPLYGYTGHRRQRGTFPKPSDPGSLLSLDTFRGAGEM